MLERNDVQIRRERAARKEPLDEKEARALIRQASEVWIARGKKTERFASGEVEPDQLRGPSGNFRAPILLRGKKLLVGYSADTLQDWFG